VRWLDRCRKAEEQIREARETGGSVYRVLQPLADDANSRWGTTVRVVSIRYGLAVYSDGGNFLIHADDQRPESLTWAITEAAMMELAAEVAILRDLNKRIREEVLRCSRSNPDD